MNSISHTFYGIALLLVTAWSMPLKAQWVPVGPTMSQVSLSAISFQDKLHGHAIGWQATQTGEGVVLHTDDGGKTWTQRVEDTTTFFVVHFLNATTGVLGGASLTTGAGVVGTTVDGGKTWKYHADTNSGGFFDISFVSQTVGFAGGTNGQVFKTTDAGTSWHVIATGIPDIFRRIAFASTAVGYGLIAPNDNFNSPTQIYKTTDGGETWKLAADFTGSKVLGDIHFLDENIGFAVGYDGETAIYRTTDGGAVWNRVYSRSGALAFQAINFVDALTGYAVGQGGRIARTTDGGMTWSQESSGTTGALSYIWAGKETVYATGYNGVILQRSNTSGTDLDVNGSTSTVKVSIRPHPVVGSAVVVVEGAASKRDLTLTIFDSRGRELMRVPIDAQGHAALNGTALPSGSYLYRLDAASGAPITGTVVVE